MCVTTWCPSRWAAPPVPWALLRRARSPCTRYRGSAGRSSGDRPHRRRRPRDGGNGVSPVTDIEFTKGHGTQNDFVVLPDEDVRLDLTVERVSALCDRQRGIGADGLLRVARAGALRAAGVLAELPTGVAERDWFMDYRNADGSIADPRGQFG